MDIYAKIKMVRDELVRDSFGTMRQTRVVQFVDVCVKHSNSKTEAMDRTRRAWRGFERPVGPIVLRNGLGFQELAPVETLKETPDFDFTLEKDGFVFEGTSPF
jgi:hypothetical protein